MAKLKNMFVCFLLRMFMLGRWEGTRGGVCVCVCVGGGAIPPYKDSTGMCRAKAPHFSALTAPKDSTFST